LEEWTKVLSILFDLAKRKPWLREECGWIIFCCIQDICAQRVDTKYAEMALEYLCRNGLARTPEGVAIWVTAKDLFPTISFPHGVWQHDNPLHFREKGSLSRIMREISKAEDDPSDDKSYAKNSGVWNPKLHFAWDSVLLRLYAQLPGQGTTADKSSNPTQAGFLDIWTEVVDSEFVPSKLQNEHLMFAIGRWIVCSCLIGRTKILGIPCFHEGHH
jgi:DNA polymerase phi